MSDELLERLKADIQKTGFGSEMSAAKVFLDSDWGCSPGKGYFDRDEGKTREIDIAAHTSRNRWTDGADIILEYHVLAEVKKSERPWIAFTHEMNHSFTDAWNNPSVHWNLPCERSEITPLLSATSTRRGISWMGYGVHEAFKDPGQPSRWYAAAVAACKACSDNLSGDSYSEKALQEFHSTTLLFFSNPLVILDGVLLRAWLDPAAQLQLEYVDFVPMEFEFRTRTLNHGSYRLDLVTLSGLPQFIARASERADRIYELLDARKQPAAS